MKNFVPKGKHGPEYYIQKSIIQFLRNKEWLVKPTHGSMFQSGFPDLYATHSSYGARWIEVKNPDKYQFTPAQLDWFPKFCSHGSGVWIMTAATEEEYKVLFRKHNWWHYLK